MTQYDVDIISLSDEELKEVLNSGVWFNEDPDNPIVICHESAEDQIIKKTQKVVNSSQRGVNE